MADQTLRSLAEEYWDAQLVAHPTLATLFGDHRFDDRIENFSAGAEAEVRSRWAALLDRLSSMHRDALTGDDLVTYEQLEAELNDGIAWIDQRLIELQSDHMTGFHIELLQSVPVMAAADEDSARMLVERFRQVPEALDQALTRFLEGAAAGRPPPAICVSRSLHMIEGYLSSPLDQDVFVRLAGPAGMDPRAEADWRDELADVVRTIVRPGYQRMAEALRERLLPQSRDNDHCGLSWLADGPSLYSTLVAHHTTVDLPPEEIHRIGMEQSTQAVPAEFAALGGRLFGITDPAAVLERLRTDPSLRYQSGEDIMLDARTAFEAATDAMPAWFGRLPKSPCGIEPVPDFLAPDSPAAYYYPPAGDGLRGGTYYVNTDAPEHKARYETASVAFHEAIPGHHLQLAIATELEDIPRFRRFSFFNTAYIEGWGLYAERLAEEMGLYRNDLERIGMLAGDSIRACRLVVDTGLHAMGWSRAQAIAFMAANTPISVEEVTVEVDRYIGMPGQALAYKIGQREIFRVRETARARLGGAFDIRGFHDAVLGSGAVGLPLLGQLVEGWVARQAA